MALSNSPAPYFCAEEGAWFDPRIKSPSVFFFGVGGYGGIALDQLIKLGTRVVGVCSRPEKRSPATTAKRWAKRLLRIPDFEQIVVDHFAGAPSPYRLARKNQIPLYQLDGLEGQMLSDIVAQARPELIICAGFPRLIPGEILKSATVAALNFHPGMLPDRAGATPVRTAILHGDSKAALTVHHMSEHFDSGNAVITLPVKVSQTDTYGSLELKLAGALPQAIAHVMTELDSLPAAELAPRVKLCPKVSKLSYSLNENPEVISRKIRALQPRAAIPIEIDGRRLAVWDHEVLDGELRIKTVFDGTRVRPYQ